MDAYVYIHTHNYNACYITIYMYCIINAGMHNIAIVCMCTASYIF